MVWLSHIIFFLWEKKLILTCRIGASFPVQSFARCQTKTKGGGQHNTKFVVFWYYYRGFLLKNNESREAAPLNFEMTSLTFSCCWVVCNRPVGFIACLRAVFSTRAHGNKTGMTRPGHSSLQNANAEQNKRRYSAHFLYNSTPSFSAPEASTARTMAGPPPDLISTWHDLSIKRPFYHWPHTGLSFCWQ